MTNIFSIINSLLIVLLGLFASCTTLFYNDAPEVWQLGFQDSASPVFSGLIELHNKIGFFLIVISLSVFWVLFALNYYYNSSRNPIAYKYLT